MEEAGVKGCAFVDYDRDVAGGVGDFVFEFFYSSREGLILGGDVSLGDSTDEMLKSERKSVMFTGSEAAKFAKINGRKTPVSNIFSRLCQEEVLQRNKLLEFREELPALSTRERSKRTAVTSTLLATRPIRMPGSSSDWSAHNLNDNGNDNISTIILKIEKLCCHMEERELCSLK